MKANSLLFMRITLGVLMLLWGVDKLINVQHSAAVSHKFYLGVASLPLLLHLGALQMLLGLAIVLGYLRRIAYSTVRKNLNTLCYSDLVNWSLMKCSRPSPETPSPVR